MTIQQRIEQLEKILDQECPATTDAHAACICMDQSEAAIELEELRKINNVAAKERPDRVMH